MERCDTGAHVGADAPLTDPIASQAAVSGGHDHLLIIWDTATGSVVQKMKGHHRVVTAVTWLGRGAHSTPVDSSHGRLFASASMDSSIKIWEQRVNKHMSRRRIATGQGSSQYEMIWMKVCEGMLHVT